MSETNNNSFVVRLYGDSLGLPRAANKISCAQTYPEILRKFWTASLPGDEVSFYNRSQGGAEIEALYNEFRSDTTYFGKTKGIIIVQCGIVDCAPRPIPPWVKYKIVAKLPGFLRNRIIGFLHNNRARIFRMGLKWYSTSPKKFKALYTKWLSQAAGECDRIYVINICPTTDKFEKQSPGLTASIEGYNELIREAVGSSTAQNVILIDMNREVLQERGTDRYIDALDGHHLTAEGHKVLSGLISAAEQAFVKRPSEALKELDLTK